MGFFLKKKSVSEEFWKSELNFLQSLPSCTCMALEKVRVKSIIMRNGGLFLGPDWTLFFFAILWTYQFVVTYNGPLFKGHCLQRQILSLGTLKRNPSINPSKQRLHYCQFVEMIRDIFHTLFEALNSKMQTQVQGLVREVNKCQM